MPNRQMTVFKIGCYLAFLTAALHMVGHLAGQQPPANDTERQLLDLATTYRFPLPGAARSMMDFLNGFSLVFSVALAWTGGLGLIVARRGVADVTLMVAFARALAGGYVVLLAISLTNFFIIPTICLAAIALCFAMASVRPPA